MLTSSLDLPRVIEEYKTIEELTLERIRRAIVTGELKPGDRIRQHLLADQLGVSRMPVRVALRRLTAEGLVAVDRGMAMVTRLSANEAEEIYAMRLGLESLAARTGAEGMTPEALETMQQLLPVMQESVDSGNTAAFISNDRAFHMAHYGMTGRPGLVGRIVELWDRGDRYMRISTTLAHTMPVSMVTHRKILEACERQDGKLAQEATREYLDYASAAVVASLRERGFGD